MESNQASVEVPGRVLLARAGVSSHVGKFIPRVSNVSRYPHNQGGCGSRLEVAVFPAHNGIQYSHTISVEGERCVFISHGQALATAAISPLRLVAGPPTLKKWTL
eukprot:1373331-Rhodomonas_salina.2